MLVVSEHFLCEHDFNLESSMGKIGKKQLASVTSPRSASMCSLDLQNSGAGSHSKLEAFTTTHSGFEDTEEDEERKFERLDSTSSGKEDTTAELEFFHHHSAAENSILQRRATERSKLSESSQDERAYDMHLLNLKAVSEGVAARVIADVKDARVLNNESYSLGAMHKDTVVDQAGPKDEGYAFSAMQPRQRYFDPHKVATLKSSLQGQDIEQVPPKPTATTMCPHRSYECGDDGEHKFDVTLSGRNKGLGKANEPKFSCQVCGDVAGGFHCGAYICEACKKFYLRCLKNGCSSYQCSKQETCLITRETRSHCQYCRYQKCLNLGMYKPGREDSRQMRVDFKSISCKVCSAPSSGYHFGAITCEGCKGFFRRMVKENLHKKFLCSGNGSCDLSTGNRTACKHCRYIKCLAIGMALQGTRLGRQSNSIKRNTLLQYSHSGQDVALNKDDISRAKLLGNFVDAPYKDIAAAQKDAAALSSSNNIKAEVDNEEEYKTAWMQQGERVWKREGAGGGGGKAPSSASINNRASSGMKLKRPSSGSTTPPQQYASSSPPQSAPTQHHQTYSQHTLAHSPNRPRSVSPEPQTKHEIDFVVMQQKVLMASDHNHKKAELHTPSSARAYHHRSPVRQLSPAQNELPEYIQGVYNELQHQGVYNELQRRGQQRAGTTGDSAAGEVLQQQLQRKREYVRCHGRTNQGPEKGSLSKNPSMYSPSPSYNRHPHSGSVTPYPQSSERIAAFEQQYRREMEDAEAMHRVLTQCDPDTLEHMHSSSFPPSPIRHSPIRHSPNSAARWQGQGQASPLSISHSQHQHCPEQVYNSMRSFPPSHTSPLARYNASPSPSSSTLATTSPTHHHHQRGQSSTTYSSPTHSSTSQGLDLYDQERHSNPYHQDKHERSPQSAALTYPYRRPSSSSSTTMITSPGRDRECMSRASTLSPTSSFQQLFPHMFSSSTSYTAVFSPSGHSNASADAAGSYPDIEKLAQVLFEHENNHEIEHKHEHENHHHHEAYHENETVGRSYNSYRHPPAPASHDSPYNSSTGSPNNLMTAHGTLNLSSRSSASPPPAHTTEPNSPRNVSIITSHNSITCKKKSQLGSSRSPHDMSIKTRTQNGEETEEEEETGRGRGGSSYYNGNAPKTTATTNGENLTMLKSLYARSPAFSQQDSPSAASEADACASQKLASLMRSSLHGILPKMRWAGILRERFEVKDVDHKLPDMRTHDPRKEAIRKIQQREQEEKASSSLLNMLKVVNEPIIDSLLEVQAVYKNSHLITSLLLEAYQELHHIMTRPAHMDELDLTTDDPECAWKVVHLSFAHHTKNIIRFIKKIPGFAQLCLENQLSLVRYSVYPITLLYHSFYYDLETGDHHWFVHTRAERDYILHHFPMFRKLSGHITYTGTVFKLLEMTPMELAFLSAITVFSIDVLLLKDGSEVLALQDLLTDAFLVASQEQAGNSASRPGVLLLRLSELERANVQHTLIAREVQAANPDLDFGQLWTESFLDDHCLP